MTTPNSGGFFAGKVAAPGAQAPEGGRFDPSSKMGQMYRARYFKNGFFDALNYLKPIAVSPNPGPGPRDLWRRG